MLGEKLVLPKPKKKRSHLRAMVLGLMTGAGVALLPAWLPGGFRFAGSGSTSLVNELHRLEVEYPLAASHEPYLVLDLVSSRLEFRFRGVVLKAIPFELDRIFRDRAQTELASDRLSLLSLEDRGAPVEVITPPDPNQTIDPLDDPSILPPEPPGSYTLGFDRPWEVRIRGVDSEGFVPSLREAAKSVQAWWDPGQGGEEENTKVEIRMAAERSREIYRALYLGEKFMVVGLGEKAE